MLGLSDPDVIIWADSVGLWGISDLCSFKPATCVLLGEENRAAILGEHDVQAIDDGTMSRGGKHTFTEVSYPAGRRGGKERLLEAKT